MASLLGHWPRQAFSKVGGWVIKKEKENLWQKGVIKKKRKKQRLVKAHCVDLVGFKPRVEPSHPCFEEIR